MHKSFLQSKEWGEFQTTVGHRAVQFGDCQGFEYRLAPGMVYLYIPRYEIKDTRDVESVIKDIRQRNRYLFLRFEPINPISSLSYHLSPTHNRQPQHTLLISISRTEDEILAAMHPKTRYNIHLAERKGVSVKEEKNVDIFWRLHEETAARDRFRGHEKMYYEHMLDMPIARQLTAYHEGVPLASHILVAFGDTCTYLHGASGNAGRNLMAPYLLQWEGMRLGKTFGCTGYDLWGVAPPGQAGSKVAASCFHGYCWDPTHSWSGITRFKAGFGGAPVSYPHAVDVVLSPLGYRAYQLIRRMRGMV